MRIPTLTASALAFALAASLSAAAQHPHLLVVTHNVPPGPDSALVTVSEASDPQVKDDLFAGTEKFAQGAKEVTEVNLDKNMLGMVGHGKKGPDELAGKMDFIVVHSYTYEKPGMYKQEDVDIFRKRLTDGSWNCFVHVKEKDSATDVCTRSGDHGESNEMVVMTSEPKELTFVHLRGRMSLDDLQKMKPGGGGGAPGLKKHD